ncbi:MAG: hypothetical protein ACUVQG_03510 [Thermogutta sp.]
MPVLILAMVLWGSAFLLIAVAESQWVVPGEVPFSQSGGQELPSDQPVVPPPSDLPQQPRNEAPDTLPQRPTSAQIRSRLDARLKAAMQRACPENARPLELGTVAQRFSSAEHRERAIVAFWRAARTAITVDFLTEALSELERLQVPPNDQVTVDSVKQLYLARFYEFRGDLQAGMVSLTEIVGMGNDQQLMFPDDIPHTGGYSTQLEKLYQGTPPLALRRLHEMIPLARQSIYLHFEAGQSARDAWLAFKDAYETRRADLWTALACWRLWVEELIRLAEAVETYNRLILEYVMASGNGHLGGESFVRMLLENESRRVVSGAVRTRGDATGTKFRSLINRDQGIDPSFDRQLQGVVNAGFQEDSFNLLAKVPRIPVFSPWAKGWERFAAIPVSMPAQEKSWVQAGLSSPYFATLPQTSAGVFVQKLAEQSFRMGELALGETNRTQHVSLDAQIVKGGNRADRVRLYWDLAVAQGKYCVFVQYSAALSEIFPHVLARWSEPGAAEDMLQLQAFRRVADAALEDIHFSVMEKGFELLEAMSSSDRAQPVAITLPYVGEYDTKWDQVKSMLPGDVRVTAAPVAFRIPAVYAALCQIGLSLSAADQSRVITASGFLQGQSGISPLLQAIDLESEIWLEFVELAGRYNQLIADYVLMVRPDLSAQEFLTAVGISSL